LNKGDKIWLQTGIRLNKGEIEVIIYGCTGWDNGIMLNKGEIVVIKYSCGWDKAE
jgi:glutamate synthase domain-containing protein 3